jgi:Ca2+-binding EF-hand superfamily protein
LAFSFVFTLYVHRWKLKIITGNGYITTSVLREILHELDDKLTPDDLDGIIAEIDEDGSGTIDFDGKTTLLELLFEEEI